MQVGRPLITLRLTPPLISQASAVAAELIPETADYPHLRHGALAAALEEYGEAALFVGWLKEHRIMTAAEIKAGEFDLSAEEYLGAVMDCTGEMGRLAVRLATSRDIAGVSQIRDAIEQLQEELMQFDFRNGSLRKKSDSIVCVRCGGLMSDATWCMSAHDSNGLLSPPSSPQKWTLRKLETMLYELNLMGGLNMQLGSSKVVIPEADDGEAGAGEAEGAGTKRRRE